MSGSRSDPLPAGSTRSLFGELVSAASSELGQHPSRRATSYLVELLDARVRQERRSAPETLAECLIEAMGTDGAQGLSRLRALGDRALFDAGFFGDSLRGRAVGVSYYSQIGSTAYRQVSTGTGSVVFHELARGFPDFVELLAEVGERARGRKAVDLLRLYDRYRETRDERHRARLLRHGLIVPRGPEDRLQ